MGLAALRRIIDQQSAFSSQQLAERHRGQSVEGIESLRKVNHWNSLRGSDLRLWKSGHSWPRKLGFLI